MSTFAVAMSSDKITFVRLPDGRWVELQPDHILWTDLPGPTCLSGEPFKHEAGDLVSAHLEHTLQQNRIKAGK